MPAFHRDTRTDSVGFWGEPTSTLDWCEENYVVTNFVAEFWNTLSNYFLFIPPLLTAFRCYQEKVDSRIFCSFLALSVVGLGSTFFHATLLYEMQLLDELPMIYGTCFMIFAIWSSDDTNSKFNYNLKVFFVCYSFAITVIYLTVVNPLIFQWCYGLTVAALIITSGYTCRTYNGSRKLLLLGFLSYGTGFILWNIDNNFCWFVRNVRNSLPWPLMVIAQLHAWWHCLAAFGTYFQILYSMDLRLRRLKWSGKFTKATANSELNNNYKNGGSCVVNIPEYTADKHNMSAKMFRDLWCWMPSDVCGKCDLFENNVAYTNGYYPT